MNGRSSTESRPAARAELGVTAILIAASGGAAFLVAVRLPATWCGQHEYAQPDQLADDAHDDDRSGYHAAPLLMPILITLSVTRVSVAFAYKASHCFER